MSPTLTSVSHGDQTTTVIIVAIAVVAMVMVAETIIATTTNTLVAIVAMEAIAIPVVMAGASIIRPRTDLATLGQ